MRLARCVPAGAMQHVGHRKAAFRDHRIVGKCRVYQYAGVGPIADIELKAFTARCLARLIRRVVRNHHRVRYVRSHHLQIIEMSTGSRSAILDKIVTVNEIGGATYFDRVLREIPHPVVLNNDIAMSRDERAAVGSSCYRAELYCKIGRLLIGVYLSGAASALKFAVGYDAPGRVDEQEDRTSVKGKIDAVDMDAAGVVDANKIVDDRNAWTAQIAPVGKHGIGRNTNAVINTSHFPRWPLDIACQQFWLLNGRVRCVRMSIVQQIEF